MYFNEYSYQKLPPPLGEYIPEKSKVDPAELSEQPAGLTDYEDRELLEMISIAVKFEKEAQEFFKHLSGAARSQKERNILRQIWLDEQKHERFFLKIYNKISGNEPQFVLDARDISDDLKKNYDSIFFDKLHCVEFFGKIRFSFSDRETRDMLHEIITDEQCHALKLSYLLGNA